jgi:indolepyruvate ferredoxin oxidoreductase
MCDVLIACDMIVGSGAAVLKTLRPGHTAAILNTDVAPTGAFQSNKHFDLGEKRMRDAIATALGDGPLFELDASRLATDLTGDSIATNILMLGYAAQKGLLPVTIASIEQAIRLNGSFVDGNLRTFALGRVAAHDPDALLRELGTPPAAVPLATVDDVLASRMRLLRAYQNPAYAERYRTFVDGIRTRIAARGIAGGERFVRDVALTLARLMAYKDEYEVARLYADPKFMQRLREQFAGDFTLRFNLAPPMLPGRDASGRPKKRSFGAWMLPAFRLLARFKFLRGTAFDPFGHFAERRLERRLIGEYRELIDGVVERLDAATLPAGIELARAAGEIGGYGPVKEAAVAQYRARLETLRADFEKAAAQPRDRAA